jgi:hypothetical protein
MLNIKSECYALTQKVVLKRDIFCRRPGCHKRSSAAHHVFKRDRLSTAFDPRYLVGLCEDDHIPWAHQQHDDFISWVISWMGEDEYFEALRISHLPVKHFDFQGAKESLLQLLLNA